MIAALALVMIAPAVAFEAVATDTPLSAICTDRPTKSNYSCTVEEGHLQFEADMVSGTLTHSADITSETWLAPNPTVKWGVSDQADIELNLAPLVVAHTNRGAGSTIAGIGDLYLRVKYRLVGRNDSVLSIAVIPYVKVPTARAGIGDREIEEGLIVPVNYKLTDAITVAAVPELDQLENGDRMGRHMNLADTLNVAYALDKATVLYVEVWAGWNRDPNGVVRQYSADVAITYALTNLLQIDVGANAGLNRATPALQCYVGLSQKF